MKSGPQRIDFSSDRIPLSVSRMWTVRSISQIVINYSRHRSSGQRRRLVTLSLNPRPTCGRQCRTTSPRLWDG